jgi:hypothetical protein
MKLSTKEIEYLIEALTEEPCQKEEYKEKKRLLKKLKQSYKKQYVLPDFEEWIDLNGYREKVNEQRRSNDVCNGYCYGCLDSDYAYDIRRYLLQKDALLSRKVYIKKGKN